MILMMEKTGVVEWALGQLKRSAPNLKELESRIF